MAPVAAGGGGELADLGDDPAGLEQRDPPVDAAQLVRAAIGDLELSGYHPPSRRWSHVRAPRAIAAIVASSEAFGV